jgi:hypothetical protein
MVVFKIMCAFFSQRLFKVWCYNIHTKVVYRGKESIKTLIVAAWMVKPA